MKEKKKKYRVYIRQINQTYVDVSAASKEEAETKAQAEWKRDYAHPTIMATECNKGN